MWFHWVALFVFGSIAGSLGDMSHVLTGTTDYSQNLSGPFIFSLVPYWVPFLMGAAACVIRLNHMSIDYIFLRQKPKYTKITLERSLKYSALFLGTYMLSGLLVNYQILDTVALITIFFLIWYRVDRTKLGLLKAAIVAPCGAAFEMTLVHFDVFWYRSDLYTINAVPPWLFVLYACASLVVGAISKRS